MEALESLPGYRSEADSEDAHLCPVGHHGVEQLR